MDNAASDERKQLSEFEISRLFDTLDLVKEKDASLFKQAIKSMLQIDTTNDKFEKMKDSLNVNQILGLYLVAIYPYCNYKFFTEYFYLLYLIVKALNDKGDMFVDKNEKRKGSVKLDEKPFCESLEVHVAAEILNLFIAELFPTYLKSMKEENKIEFKYLGFEDEHIKNLILMCKYLANWLFNNEFTEYRVEINVDF